MMSLHELEVALQNGENGHCANTLTFDGAPGEIERARAILRDMLEAALHFEYGRAIDVITSAWIADGTDAGPESLHRFIHERAQTMTLAACWAVMYAAALPYTCLARRLNRYVPRLADYIDCGEF